MTIKNFINIITVCVELIISPNAKCYKILIILFPANYRLGEADAVKDVLSSSTTIITSDILIF